MGCYHHAHDCMSLVSFDKCVFSKTIDVNSSSKALVFHFALVLHASNSWENTGDITFI